LSPCGYSQPDAFDFAERQTILGAIVKFGGAGTLVRGHGLGVFYSHTLKAAERLDRREEVREQIRTVVVARKGFVAQVLGRELGLPTPQKGLPAPHCSCR